MEHLNLTSLQNPRIKRLLDLRERKERDHSQLFLIEGYREILRAVQAGWKIDELFVCEDFFLGDNEPELIRSIVNQKATLYTCHTKVFQKISYRDRPDGLLAVAPQRKSSLSQFIQQSRNELPFYVIAEAIEKPGNLGTILRSSDAVKVDGLIVCDRCTDIYNPNVVRASVGTLFTVPTVEAKSEETLEWLKDNRILVLAATPHADAEFTHVDLNRPVAIAVGTEQLGLSEKWMTQADIQVRIPMNGVADSLNVAMATTLLLYEVLRQRQKNG